MFADSLFESAPNSGHRTAWTKLISTFLQATALSIALTLPLFHVERLHVIPPPPSIQMMAARQSIATQPPSATVSSSAAVAFTHEFVHMMYSHHPVTTGNSQAEAPPADLSITCLTNCTAMGLGILTPPGTFRVPAPPNHESSRPLRISEMQLGDLIHRVIPEYPAIAKQLHVQGAVLLLATIGKNGHVEQVQAISGPPLLQHAAKQAVEQWQYRPYVLNHEAIEVQTQITVNFVLNRE